MRQFTFATEPVHTVEPTKDFWLAEMERCKDPYYYYINYYTVNGKASRFLSKEDWIFMNNYYSDENLKRSHRYVLIQNQHIKKLIK